MSITAEEYREFLLTIVAAVLEAHEAGEPGIPVGHLYAPVMGRLSRTLFDEGLALLERRALVERHGDLLRPGALLLLDNTNNNTN